MPLPDANKYSDRVYELLKETDLQNLSYNQYKNVVEKLFIEPENEDEMRRAVLIQMARMAVRGSWDGFLTGGGGSGAPTDAEYVVMALNGTLTNERKLTAGTGISIIDGGSGGNVTIASTVTSGIGGSIADTQVAVGSGTDTISGSTALIFSTSTLTVKNQIELGNVGAAGILKNSQNNQDLRLQVAGTGNIRIENQTTNTASQLNVKGNGTGTPIINLSNDTKSVTLQCDDNQKLTVKGGTDSFVLDVSSSSSGLQFPDGTIQTTAASGGGGSATIGLAPIAVQLDATYSRLQPWDVYTLNGVTLTNASQDNYTIYWRFVAPKTGNLSEIAIRTNTTNTSTDSVIAGIYDIDSDGYPNSLLGSVTIDPNGGADIYTTSVSGTLSLTAGATYWFATAMDNTGTTTPTLYVVDRASQTSGLGLSHYNGTVYNCIRSTSNSNSLPASFVKGDNQLNKINHVAWTIKY